MFYQSAHGFYYAHDVEHWVVVTTWQGEVVGAPQLLGHIF